MGWIAPDDLITYTKNTPIAFFMMKPNTQQIEHNTRLLLKSCQDGNIAEVQRLFPVSSDVVNQALEIAAQYGHFDVLEFFIPLHSVSSGALINAASRGYLRIVERLVFLPGVHDETKNNALMWAAVFGHLDIVQFLLPLSDPKFNNSAALQSAVAQGQIECVDVLYPVSDPLRALHDLKEQYLNQPEVVFSLEARIEAEQLSAMLQHEIDDAPRLNVQRKM